MTTTAGDQLKINRLMKKFETIVDMVTPKDNKGAYKFIKLLNYFRSEKYWWSHYFHHISRLTPENV